MPTPRVVTTWRIVFLLAILLVHAAPALSLEDGEMDVLRMFYDDRDLQLSVTRNAAPISTVAENVTVITAAEIEAMNAHTAGDVLQNVTGVQVELRGGPGAPNPVYIRGGSFNHTRVLLDGVSISDLTSNVPVVEAIPARIIQRIEIMKGPSSFAWGAALNGVINIVTKEPGDSPIRGSLYASGGSNGFRDAGGELSGTTGNLGYYLYGSHLGFDNLGTDSSVNNYGGFGKIRWMLPAGEVTAGYLYDPVNFRQGDILVDKGSLEGDMLGYLRGRFSLGSRVELEGVLHAATHPFEINPVFPNGMRQFRSGADFSGSADLVLRYTGDRNRISLGYDYQNGRTWFRSKVVLGDDVLAQSYERHHIIKNGLFLTDTLTLGDLSITPSIRYDETNRFLNRHDFSTNLGVVYHLNDSTILRASAGNGYGYPEAVEDQIPQKICAVQGGVESTAMPYLWARTTVYYNEIRNIVWTDGLIDERKIGIEVELKTVPIFDTTLSAGFMFQDVSDMKTGDAIKGEPTHSWNVGVHYNDGKGLRATLLSRYVWWNAVPDYSSKYNSFIWDFTGSKKFTLRENIQPEVFFTIHNIFEGHNYLYTFWKNPGRWAEGGIRFSF